MATQPLPAPGADYDFPPNAWRILTAMQASRRQHWSIGDLSKKLHLKIGTIQANLVPLVRARLVDSKRMVLASRLFVKKEIRQQRYFLTARSAKVKIDDTYSLTMDFIENECAREGHCSRTQTYIAKRIKRSRDGVCVAIAKARNEKPTPKINVVEHGQYNTITMVGQAAPELLTRTEGKLLKFMADVCARTGLVSYNRAKFAKGGGVDPANVKLYLEKLRGKCRIGIIPGHPDVYFVPGVVGDFPGEPPVFSKEEAVLEVMRDELGGSTGSLKYETIANAIRRSPDTVPIWVRTLIRNNLVFVTQRGPARRPHTYAIAELGSNKALWTQPGIELVPAPGTSDLNRKTGPGRDRTPENQEIIDYWVKNEAPMSITAAYAERGLKVLRHNEFSKTTTGSDSRRKLINSFASAIRRSPEFERAKLVSATK